jgi:hypothetical protein
MRSQRITGSANTDDIRAKGGDDTIDVGGGDDVMDGSTGSDDNCEGKAGGVFLKCEHISVFYCSLRSLAPAWCRAFRSLPRYA